MNPTARRRWLCAVVVAFAASAPGATGITVAGSIAVQRTRRWRHAQDQLVGDLRRDLQVAQRLPLGMVPNVEYFETEVPLDVGDALVLLTDGIVEAKAPDNELFGFSRVMHSIASADDASSTRQRLLDNVLAHMSGREQDDDMTLVVVRMVDRTET